MNVNSATIAKKTPIKTPVTFRFLSNDIYVLHFIFYPVEK